MEPCIPDISWYGWELQRLFPEAVDVVAAEERFQGVTVDSRHPAVGGIFLALRGRTVDAHTKLPEAFAGGVRLAIVERTVWCQFPTDWQHRYRCVPVVSPLKALGELARVHRQRFQVPVVAVAGSAGKTTTKELIAAVLASRFRVLKTEGNENNQLGVPLTVLQLRPEHDVAVLELGTNSFGEIARLCQLVQPTHGVITALGEEHLEFFGNMRGVVQEETALVRFLRARGGRLIVPAEQPWIAPQSGDITVGVTPEADLWALFAIGDSGYPTVQLRGLVTTRPFQLRYVGAVAVRAAVAAAAVGWALGVPAEAIADVLACYEPPLSTAGYGRMIRQVLPNGVIVLNDSYNANPLSMQAALEMLATFPCRGRRWAVLGDMLELGAAARSAHQAILELACAVADEVCVVGTEFAAVAADFPRVRLCRSHQEAAEQLRMARPGDVVLLKGSRAMAMERVLQLYHQGLGRAQGDAVPSGTLDLEGV